MSVGFGFSIGDILLMSQLAHRLFTAITGSKHASKKLKQLGNTLFDLHCALDHLEKTANRISPRVLSGLDENGGVGNSLHSMIDSCASTLNELDEATRKYRDIDAQGEVDTAAFFGSAPEAACRQRTMERWRRQLKVQWNKVYWDFKDSSIMAYQQKLLYHTVTINMVLSSFIWSATDRLEATSQEQIDMLQAVRDQGIRVNDGMIEAVEGIRKLTLVPTSNSAPEITDEDTARMRIVASTRSPRRPPQRRYSQLPESIELINESRQAIGVMQQLRQGVKSIFRPLPHPTDLDIEAREGEVITWIHLIDEFFNSNTSPFRLNGFTAIMETNSINELVELLIDLNRAIERSDDVVRQAFYEGADQARIDLVFRRLRVISRSVRCVKEIGEFKEMRLEWDKGREQKKPAPKLLDEYKYIQ